MKPRPPQPWPVRVLHWANVIVLTLMAGSGLQIFVAYPFLGPQGDRYRWFPREGLMPPRWARMGGWLAGARHWHFGVAWALVGVGVAYVTWLLLTGEWRRRMFIPRRDGPDLLRVIKQYVRLKNAPPIGLYNGLQRLAYTIVLVLGVVSVLTGLVLYKPVQWQVLGKLTGGYEGARLIHFFSLGALALFTVGHVVMVLLHPASLREMITGGQRE